MALVGYSDSDNSDAEDSRPKLGETSVNERKRTKPRFQKLIDKSHPHKIQVSLGESDINGDSKEVEDELERPGKRPHLGNGLSGFNAMLPAPKKSQPTPSNASSSGPRKSIGSGVSLKTGPAPSFSREPMPSTELDADDVPIANDGSAALEDRPQQRFKAASAADGVSSPPPNQPEPTKTGNAMRFKPLSVVRKPQKKKPVPPSATNVSEQREQANGSISGAARPARVSLFSMEDSEKDRSIPEKPGAEEYQPYLVEARNQRDELEAVEALPQTEPAQTAAQSQPGQAESLDALASSLHLTAAQRRQLFGRNATDRQVAVASFSADAEYTANEAQRRAAEADGAPQAQAHNPVRAIAPGKHSLRQLVNAVAGQRDALEESFAAGKRNRQEAGSKYGW